MMMTSGAVPLAAAAALVSVVTGVWASAPALAQTRPGTPQPTTLQQPASPPLGDPTRPPRDYLGPTAAGADQPSTAQIVVISRNRKFATINGERVALGARYGDSRVVSISDEEVVLEGRGGKETIRLYSSANKAMRRTNEEAARESDRAAGTKAAR